MPESATDVAAEAAEARARMAKRGAGNQDRPIREIPEGAKKLLKRLKVIAPQVIAATDLRDRLYLERRRLFHELRGMGVTAVAIAEAADVTKEAVFQALRTPVPEDEEEA